MVDLHVEDEKEEFDLIDPDSLEPPFSFSLPSTSRVPPHLPKIQQLEEGYTFLGLTD